MENTCWIYKDEVPLSFWNWLLNQVPFDKVMSNEEITAIEIEIVTVSNNKD
jgi:hypothetical protein